QVHDIVARVLAGRGIGIDEAPGFLAPSLRDLTPDPSVLTDMDRAAERIADAVRDTEVPVYAFVNRRAFSAGALIALATDRVYMLPGSVIGAATPVGGTGEKAPEKIVSAMRSEMRALAEEHGLDPRVAEAMVDEEIEIEGVIERGKLLTLTTAEAEALGYAEQVESWDALVVAVGGSATTPVQDVQTNWAEKLVRVLTHPAVAPFLLSIGFLGLLVEIKTPGLGLGGAAGFLALSLFFGSHLILGLAGWEDMLVFGLGVVLLAVEAFVLPGFGIFGVLGLGGVAAGLYMSMLGSFPTTADLAQATGVLGASVIMMVVTGWALLRRIPTSGRLARRGILLETETDRSLGYISAAVRADLIGREGVADTDLRPTGAGLFGDERIDVVSETGWIPRGGRIRVVQSQGYRHVVRGITE
ncbi:MAG: hypothetical protein KC645_12095, partial [Gemmatimonadetes bacterium]|nr:hypothetical protein [Gemmatimonadota bacterium]